MAARPDPGGLLKLAYAQARRGLAEGGVPIGVATTRLHDQACVDLFGGWMATDPKAWSAVPSSADGHKDARD